MIEQLDATEPWPKIPQVWDVKTYPPKSTFKTQVAFSSSLDVDSLIFSVLW